ncbi:MAG: glycoside hydrolase family 95 protein [Alteraurantiacibacter sp.]
MAASGAAVAVPGLPATSTPSPHPQRLWYRQPAAQWVEALPVGNGRIGAMVHGGIAREVLPLNEDTLYAGGPYDSVNPRAAASLAEVRRLIFEQRYAEADALVDRDLMAVPLKQAPYQAIGTLVIDHLGLNEAEAHDYERSLDLDSAVAETRFAVGRQRFRRRVIASPVDQVIAVEIDASRARSLSLRLSFTSPHADWRVVAEGSDTLVLSGRNGAHDRIAGALGFEARLQVITQGGTLASDGDGLAVRHADKVVLLLAMATSYRRFDDVSGDPAAANRAVLAAASALPFATLLSRSTDEHRRLFRRVSVDLGTTPAAALPTDQRIARSQQVDDPALAALYFDYARYLLIASSRPGSQPANLQGVWAEGLDPPWGCKYTININTQMNYWPAQRLALPECVEPLERMLRELAVTGERTARTMYGARGWVAHHNTDLWRATAPIDGAKWGMWPTGGAWLCTHLWEHYLFQQDNAWLASVYPVMRGAALFFLDTLQVDPASGHLVTNPSLSPENTHGHGSALIHGPAMDMQILRDLFGQVAQAAAILGTDAELATQFTAARARLLPDRIGAQGQLQEWPYDWDALAEEPHHRHVSHLYGLYPSHQISLDDTPDLAAAARRSLDLRGDQATGWATAWRINLWARLRDGERAHAILRFLLGPERTYPNMFDAHPPFQIDGNFGGAAGIAELLVQEDDAAVTLLPALPRAWPTGALRGVRLRGGVRLDVTWADGELVEARLSGGTGANQQIRLREGSVEVLVAPDRPVTLRLGDFT